MQGSCVAGKCMRGKHKEGEWGYLYLFQYFSGVIPEAFADFRVRSYETPSIPSVFPGLNILTQTVNRHK